METKTVQVFLRQQSGYAFTVEFGEGIADLATDEPAPLGEGRQEADESLETNGVAFNKDAANKIREANG